MHKHRRKITTFFVSAFCVATIILGHIMNRVEVVCFLKARFLVFGFILFCFIRQQKFVVGSYFNLVATFAREFALIEAVAA